MKEEDTSILSKGTRKQKIKQHKITEKKKTAKPIIRQLKAT